MSTHTYNDLVEMADDICALAGHLRIAAKEHTKMTADQEKLHKHQISMLDGVVIEGLQEEIRRLESEIKDLETAADGYVERHIEIVAQLKAKVECQKINPTLVAQRLPCPHKVAKSMALKCVELGLDGPTESMVSEMINDNIDNIMGSCMDPDLICNIRGIREALDDC